jgi:hypothetical protein
LYLRSLAEVWEFAQFNQEFVEIVFSFFHKFRCHVTLALLGGYRWNKETRIAAIKEFSKSKKLAISSETIDFSETVITLDEIFSMLFHSNTFGLAFEDLSLHDSIVALDVVHLYGH